ncbi:MAG: ribonuclease P protein component [Desulforhopalus sp.]
MTLATHRLSKTSLLRKNWEFNEVYDRGKRLHGKGFVLICRPNSMHKSRLGISVHRKIRGAVKRNRIKRIIRESFRLGQKHYPHGQDIVFAVRKHFPYTHPTDIIEVVAELATGYSCSQAA